MQGGGKASPVLVENGSVAVFGLLGRGKNTTIRGSWEHLTLETRLTIAFSDGYAYVIGRTGTR